MKSLTRFLKTIAALYYALLLLAPARFVPTHAVLFYCTTGALLLVAITPTRWLTSRNPMFIGLVILTTVPTVITLGCFFSRTDPFRADDVALGLSLTLFTVILQMSLPASILIQKKNERPNQVPEDTARQLADPQH
jgi:hypothetical protein